MTEQTETVIAPPDLTWPPNPFNHGPCRFNVANGYAEDCPFPAVFEGGACASHVAVISVANMQAGYDPMGKVKLPKKRTSTRNPAKRRAANASRRRNRR